MNPVLDSEHEAMARWLDDAPIPHVALWGALAALDVSCIRQVIGLH